MTFDLKVITIETKPRAGYFILDEGEFSTVKKVVPQRSEVYLDNGKVLSIADASKKVAKLIGEVTTEQEDKVITKTYSIIHSDFSGIIRGIEVLGEKEAPQWTRDQDGLKIKTKMIDHNYPVVFKISVN